MANPQDDFDPAEADEVLADVDDALADRPIERQAGGDLDDLQAELDDLKDRLLRSQAETENVRRRTQRELQESRRYANQTLLLDLLPVIDNIERAISAAKESQEATGLLEGFEMVHQLLLATLDKHHCRPVPAEGKAFDPAIHEAISHLPSPDHERGSVMVVSQQGYQLHDRVIRPAQVVVSAGSPSQQSNS